MSDPFAFANPLANANANANPLQRTAVSSDPFSDLLQFAATPAPAPSAPKTAQQLPPFVPAPTSSSASAFPDPFAGLTSFQAAPSNPLQRPAPSATPSLAALPSVPHHTAAPVLSLSTLSGLHADESSTSTSSISAPLSPLSPASDAALLQQILNEEKTETNGGSSAPYTPSAAASTPAFDSFSSLQASSPPTSSAPVRKMAGKVVTPLSPGEIASISDPLRRAEAVEQQKSLIGNYRIVAPLKAKREQLRHQPVQNILRLQPMQGIKAELDRARGQLGEATCSAIGQRYLAVGMARGVTLVFNHFEQLQMVLGKALEDGKNRGPTTCIDFSPTGDHLVVGHARGVVVMWDLSTKKEVKDIKDASPRPITHVRFTKRGRPVFVAVDDMGIVTLFTLNKVSILINVHRQVLLQGKAGRVLALSVLMANPDFPHLSDSFGLIAIATETMMTVIALEPALRIAYRLPREEDARTGVIPSLCWRALQARDETVGRSTETSEREVLLVRHPVLVTARGSIISYVQVSPFEKHEIAEQRPDVPLKFNHVGMISVQGEVAAIEWLGGQVLTAVTKDERIHVIDPFEINDTLDNVAIPYLNLVMQKHFPNPDSGALEDSSDGSVRASDNSLLILGNASVVVVKVLTWSDRVDALIANNQWTEALALALDFYEGQAKAAIGLPRDPKSLKAKLRDQVIEYVVQYVTAGLSAERSVADRVQLRVIGGCAMEYCREIDRLDLIFTDIYAKFLHLSATDVLCELLEPYILNDYLPVLEPHVMGNSNRDASPAWSSSLYASPLWSKFLNYYLADSSRLLQLEQAILHLDPMKLDLNQILPTCRQLRLFTALTYIYNQALNDFATPISDIATAIVLGLGFHPLVGIDPNDLLGGGGGGGGQQVDEPPMLDDDGVEISNERVVIGARLPALSAKDKTDLAFTLLLYIDYAFTGRAFPNATDLPDEWFSGVKAQILALLFARTASMSAARNTAPIPLPSYPWLSFFLNVSCKHTLNVVGMAFDSQDWTGYIDTLGEGEEAAPGGAAAAGGAGMAGSAAAGLLLAPESIPIPEGESLPEEFLQQAAQAQAMAMLGADADNPHHLPLVGDFTAPDAVVRLTASGVPSRQRMLDALTFLIIDQAQQVPSDVAQASNPYNPHPLIYQAKASDCSELFQFAAKYLGKGVVQASASLLDRIFASLTDVADLTDSVEGKKERHKRETLLVTLLGRCGSGYDYESLLVRCQQARFYQVCVFLYKKRKDFPRILQYYLEGIRSAAEASSSTPAPTDDGSIFDYICSAIAEAQAHNQQSTLAELRKAVLNRLPDLVRTDPTITAKIIVQHFSKDNDRVVNALDNHAELQFAYLKAIMAGTQETAEHSGTAPSSTASSPPQSPTGGSLFLSTGGYGSALAETTQSSMSDLLERAGLTFSPRMHEAYVKLLCQFDQHAVLPHLTSHHDYNIESVLRLCQERGIDDASAYLLERTGDVSGALELMLKSVDKRVRDLRVYVEAHWQEFEALEQPQPVPERRLSSAAPSPYRKQSVDGRGPAGTVVPGTAGTVVSLDASPGYLHCHKLVLEAIAQASHLCQRSADGEKLWFTLLDRFVQLQRQLTSNAANGGSKAAPAAILTGPMHERASTYLHSALIGYVRTVLHSMMGYVALPAILRKITTDHQADELRDFRDTIVSMLDTYSYEQSILHTATQLINADKYFQIAQLAAKHASAFAPRSDFCDHCHLPLVDASIALNITLFDCGHAFHDTCLKKQADHCPLCQAQNLVQKKSTHAHPRPATTNTLCKLSPHPRFAVCVQAHTSSGRSCGGRRRILLVGCVDVGVFAVRLSVVRRAACNDAQGRGKEAQQSPYSRHNTPLLVALAPPGIAQRQLTSSTLATGERGASPGAGDEGQPPRLSHPLHHTGPRARSHLIPCAFSPCCARFASSLLFQLTMAQKKSVLTSPSAHCSRAPVLAWSCI